MNSYPYADLPLRPPMILKLINEIVPLGATKTRNEIEKEVLKLHLTRGGKPALTAKAQQNAFKRVLTRLKVEGSWQNPTKGHWRKRALGTSLLADSRELVGCEDVSTMTTHEHRASPDGVYGGLPMNASIARSIIVQVMPPGCVMLRDDIVEAVFKHYQKAGGLAVPGTRAAAIVPIKQALAQLKRAASVENPTKGHWRFLRKLKEDELKAHQNRAQGTSRPSPDKQVRYDYTNHVEIGDGSEVVYLMTGERDCLDAAREKATIWPHKVGIAKVAALRLAGQQTGNPQRLFHTLIIKTNDARRLEARLKEDLGKGGKLTTGGGKEWFHTSTERVMSWYQAQQKGLHVLDPVMPPHVVYERPSSSGPVI